MSQFAERVLTFARVPSSKTANILRAHVDRMKRADMLPLNIGETRVIELIDERCIKSLIATAALRPSSTAAAAS